jgi:hypothetical protein
MQMQTLEREVEEILDKHFPAGLPPSRVTAALLRGDAKVVTEEERPPDHHSSRQAG